MYNINDEIITIKSKGRIDVIDKKDIRFIFSSKRKVYIKTVSGTLSCYRRLDEFERELKDRRFLRIHKSILVNAVFVQQVNGNRLYLKDGGQDYLTISRGYRKRVLDYYCCKSEKDSHNS